MAHREQNGRIDAMFRYPEKKGLPVAEKELKLIEDLGIEGDLHADGGERQVSLLTLEDKKWMEAQKTKGFCFGKYKENILLDGISLQQCSMGDLLACGEAVLEITAAVKGCHTEFCSLAASGKKCILADSSKFAKVKKGGIIKKEMEISVFYHKESGDWEENLK